MCSVHYSSRRGGMHSVVQQETKHDQRNPFLAAAVLSTFSPCHQNECWPGHISHARLPLIHLLPRLPSSRGRAAWCPGRCLACCSDRLLPGMWRLSGPIGIEAAPPAEFVISLYPRSLLSRPPKLSYAADLHVQEGGPCMTVPKCYDNQRCHSSIMLTCS